MQKKTEDSNDKSSDRLQRRIFRRRLNYATSILFLSLCYVLFMNTNNNNNSTHPRSAVNTKAWKIKRALEIMKQREKNSDNNNNRHSHSNYDDDIRRHHDVERGQEIRKNSREDQNNYVDNRNEYFGVRGGTRGENNNHDNQHDPDEIMNDPRMRHLQHPKVNGFDRSREGDERGNQHKNRAIAQENNGRRVIDLGNGRKVIVEDHNERRDVNIDHNHRDRDRGDRFGVKVVDNKRTPTNPPRKLDATHPYKWINAKILPKIPGKNTNLPNPEQSMLLDGIEKLQRHGHNQIDFRINYEDEKDEFKAWEKEMQHYNDNLSDDNIFKPKVDYRTDVEYVYPEVIMSPPEEGGYPKLQSLSSLLKEWPQDDIDLENSNTNKQMKEVLLHFDYSNITERNAALKFRDKELPFKVYNVPEINQASSKWTDEYVSQEFEHSYQGRTARGDCQQSDNNYFAFFNNRHWDVEMMGSPPTMDNDIDYKKWAKHARYADLKSIPFYHRHYYWQSGAGHNEVNKDSSKQSFISSDLPSFSSNENNFFSFHAEDQKGIQCRFGERGVTAATHYDTGRNMIAMIKGSKRYILSPPKSCDLLGIVIEQKHPVWRHSILNFAHINLSKEQTIGMSNEERQWLQRAATAPSLSTVLNEGEVLYVPSHWFHYITSLQKSAQCNVRSGRNAYGSKEFGGLHDVEKCVDIDANDNNSHREYADGGENIYDNHY